MRKLCRRCLYFAVCVASGEKRYWPEPSTARTNADGVLEVYQECHAARMGGRVPDVVGFWTVTKEVV